MVSRRRIAFFLACALLALVVNGALALANTQAIISYEGDVVHSDAVLTDLQGVMLTIVDAETGQRGYVITGQQTYLGPYTRALHRVGPALTRIRLIATDNQAIRRDTPALRRAVKAKFAELQQTITLRRQGKVDAAVRIVLEGRGRRLMLRIRSLVGGMETDERRLLARQSQDANFSERRAIVSSAIGALANAALLIFLFYLVRRWWDRREQFVIERQTSLERERTLRLDIERVAAEREAILGQIADAVVVINAMGAVTFMNDAARALFGTNDNLRMSEILAELPVHQQDGQDAEQNLTFGEALEWGGAMLSAETEIRSAAGEDLVLQGSISEVTGPNGGRIGVVAVFRDITAQRALEHDKDNFLSSAAHDLKTPLATIKGVAQLMERRVRRSQPYGSDNLIEGLERIDLTATRMSGLITELLDISRLRMGQPLDLMLQTSDLVDLVRGRVQELAMGQRNHDIVFDSDSEHVLGLWDVPRLERVIDNLLSNAIKYSPSGGEVRVRVSVQERDGEPRAVISVADHGVGIPDPEIPYVFERFRRASNVSAEIPGTGVGLAAARQLVQEHGGSIDLISREGEGTTVTIELPIRASD